MASKKKLSLLSTILCASFAAFILLATVPPPGAQITLVTANPGLRTETTKIVNMGIHSPGEGPPGETIATFTATGQTKTVEVGTEIDVVNARVLVDTDYVGTDPSGEDAIAWTKVTLDFKDPSAGTVWSGEMTVPTTPDLYYAEGYWEIHYQSGAIIHTLVEGQYTLTLTYEIYIE